MLIGLCGKPQSGKSEVRFLLEERFGFQSINTKRPLALACHELTGIPHSQFLTQEGKAQLYKGIPLRNIMGKVQDTLEQMFGDYHTIEAALERIPDIHSGNFVLDSLRKTQPLSFPGIVVEVTSINSIDTGNEFDYYDNSTVRYVIENNGSFGDLEQTITKLMDIIHA
jgi:hypothetical protein